MKHVWTLATVTAVLLAGRAPANALGVTAGRSAAAPDDGAPSVTAVTGVSVVPSTGRAEVVIDVDSSASVQDFVIESTPYRVVLDFTGAKLGVAPRFYDRVARGGVTNVRYSQYRPGVVRVVIELDGPHEYTMTRGGHDVRVAIDGDGATFTAWHWTGAEAAVAVLPASEPAARTANATATANSDARVPDVTVTPDNIRAPVTETDAGRLASTTRSRPHPSLFYQHGQQSSQPRITVTYQDADIRDVLAAFAAFSGRTIVVGREVAGTVTAEVRDQPWDVALQSILGAQQLAASEDQYGIITVDSYKNIQAKQASEPLVTQLVAINYASAASMVATVKSLLARDCQNNATAATAGTAAPQNSSCQPRGNVVADTGTNTLLITEAQSHMSDVVNYVRDLDIRTPQVSIKAKIIFIDRTHVNQLGLAYDFGDNGTFFNSLVQRTDPATNSPYDPTVTVVNLGGDALAGVSNAARPYAQNAALNLLYTAAIGRFSITSFLDATSSLSISDVQAEPSVVTLNNREAQIQVGEETPIRVIDASSAATGGAAVATVTFKETGIILNVTPHITNDGQILLQLHAEQSQLQNVGGDLGYNFFKRAADTKLLVSDGETAVIGGLTETTVTKNRNAIPILGELPLIGNLFAQTNSQDEKQDLLILITPHVLHETDAVRK
jgi:type IV pilus assembly protein PilQ